jgi:hypothetical protein
MCISTTVTQWSLNGGGLLIEVRMYGIGAFGTGPSGLCMISEYSLKGCIIIIPVNDDVFMNNS